MNNLELKAGQVAAVVGIDSKQLQNAVDAGYVRPSITGRGRGSIHLYNIEDVVRIRVFHILVKAYGVEQGRAARMLRSAWPRRFTARKQILMIVPSKEAADKRITLEPIKIPLAQIVTETTKRISQVQETYIEKKRGRPEGWSKQMQESLAEVSGHLQGVSDDDIMREVASHRASRNGRRKGAKKR
jgi:hypothetical protein